MEEKFLELFAEVLEREEDEGPLKLRDKLEDFKMWDSLAAISLVSMLDDEYGIIMGSKDMEKVKTIQDVFDFVIKKQSK